MLKGFEKMDSTIFYGRPLGFQFSPSVNRVFRIIGVILASYSLTWEKGQGKLGSLINTGRFFLSPEQRASRIIKVTKEADINFCKGFWNLSELTNNMPKFFCPNMAVNELREINWVGPITMETSSGGTVKIPEPSAHTGPRPVKYRIFSAVNRQHVSPSSASNIQPPSKYLVIHCHGGGYVATSSKSHETYLRVWAKLLNCTVVSIEYSLAPENPFPRPTEEVLFAYAWMINNPQLVGWTGEKLCMVGDSAGGNLIMSVNLRLIELNVKRKPDGLVPVYTPFLFQYLPSPSRMLSVMDPLLHMGVVLRCVAAYTGAYGKHNKQENTVNEQTTHRSLQDYVDQVQKQRIEFEGGSQSIVSLVQGNGHDYKISPQNGNSYFITEQNNEANGVQKNGKALMKGETIEVIETTTDEDNSSEDDEADTTSISSVHVESDPYRIQLTETLCDGQLLDFLIKHPATKDQLTMINENGETIEDGVEAMKFENNDSHSEDSITTNNNNNVVKRPKLLSMISIGSRKSSQNGNSNSATAPTTPYENHANGHRTIASSLSVHSFPMTSVHTKRSISQSLADTAVMAAGHAIDNLQDWLEKPTKHKLERTTSHKEPQMVKTPTETKSHLLELLSNSSVPRDPLISPMYASDEVIRQLPPIYFVACHLDPLLDDTIEFAKKLRAAGGKVGSIDLLPSVPHGFLNFTMMSPECRQGAKICLQRIKQALGFNLS
ncbi:hypothetical protein WR25_14542 isoform D [Diploscapter pachys]|nr:hypothetical protein WR25_14542 isoform B [Diploscapter pachys]PAV81169.1 hypothetical protein WR25_14542 isoform C [Diploscapter pachys]PAV81170.1 hypothetical protein WR25_14542 isoform D [Diploscapter pachys]